MATSSNFSTTNQYIKYRIEVTTNSQNIANNTSNVTVKVFVWRTNTGYTTAGAGTVYCAINGSNYSSPIVFAQKITSSGIYLFSKTLDIPHNSDGTKNLSVAAYIDHATFSSNSQSASFALATIPRKSSVTCQSFNIGDSTTITIGSKSSSFTHTVTYNYGTLSGTIAEKTSATSIGWTPDKVSFYGQIPNGTTGYGSVTCTTYSGNTVVGTSTAEFKAYAVESECKPSVSAAIIDTNTDVVAVTGSNSIIVKHLSKPKVTMTANSKYSSSIKSRSMVWGDGNSSTTTPHTFSNGITSPLLSVSATDSRNYINSAAYNLSTLSRWVEYVMLAFTQIHFTRTESTADIVKINIKGNYYNGNIGKTANTLSLKYRYKADEEGSTFGSYVTVTPTITNNTFSFTAELNNIDHKKQYIFEFVAEDELMIANSGEKILEKGESILRLGNDYVKLGGKLIDEDKTIVTNGLSLYKTGGTDINPDTTLEELILTETNVPNEGGFWYVRTMFYASKTTTSNRTQVAYPYAYNTNVKTNVYMRTYVTGIGWSEWNPVGNKINASDYAGTFITGKQMLETGWVTITPVANTPTSVSVAFKQAYKKIPVVIPVPSTGVLGTQVHGASVNGISKTHVNIVINRTNTTPTTVYYYVLGEVA